MSDVQYFTLSPKGAYWVEETMRRAEAEGVAQGSGRWYEIGRQVEREVRYARPDMTRMTFPERAWAWVRKVWRKGAK